MSDTYVGVRVQGGLLPEELVSRLASGNTDQLQGLSSADYGLAAGESVREAANRVWAYLRSAWTGYRRSLDALAEGDRATTLTRDRWLQILLEQLGYGRVPTASAGGLTAEGKSFPISHVWEHVPVHLLGARIALDHRSGGVQGAAGQAPQSMVQDFLNRSDSHLWAILSNGTTLRLLRDSTSLVGSAYVEFDLESIFDGDLFSDFLVLYTLCHSSRLTVTDEHVGPESCWLEKWRNEAFEAGSRALDQLRAGVVEALETLGTGFLTHPTNSELRRRVESGELDLGDFNHGLLRVVYRLLFTFVAEDRGVLLAPDADRAALQRYAEYFSTARLRRVARRRLGGRHSDRWQALQLVWGGLGRPEGRPELAIAGIGGLFEDGELDFLGKEGLSNEALLKAVRSLSVVTERGSNQLRVVNHRDLDAEELGSIYEALLEYVPEWDSTKRQYTLASAAGNQRKTTGSYYTPTSLIENLLDTALDPVLDQAEKGTAIAEDREAALLALTVCDPACGSGHFLVAAARRIAKRLAAVRTGDPEPPPAVIRTALREVIGSCIYGVDLNPLAAELAKVSLWLEAMEPGKPLAFLDAQIKVGNALIGATPKLLDEGLPQEAFKPLQGDDKKVAQRLAKENKKEAGGEKTLFETDEAKSNNADLAAAAEKLIGARLSLAAIHTQERRRREYVDSQAFRRAKEHADAWCAAFVWPKTVAGVSCPTNATLEDLREHPAPEHLAAEIDRLATEYGFFHWHLEFPHIFPTEQPETGGSFNEAAGWYGGFDVMLGNPPWDRVKLQEQEFFASRDAEVAEAPNAAARKRLIKKLEEERPTLHAEFLAAGRRAEGTSHILRNSGRYPLTGRGDINTYQVFAEGSRLLVSSGGRMGVIVPTGIATDATTQHFFRDLVETKSLMNLYDFENRKPLFDGVDSRTKFCLLTLAGRDDEVGAADFAFFAHDPTDLRREDVRFTMTPEEIKLLNPNTGTCPVFRSRRDAEITLGIYKRVPVLIDENDPENGNPWGIKFMRMFDMSNDSHLFHTREELEDDGWTLNGNVFERPVTNYGERGGVTVERMLPLYEAKMIHHYDTRWATYEPDGSTRDVTPEEKADPDFHPMPRYWVHEVEVDKAFKRVNCDDQMMFSWRGIARTTDIRTAIGAVHPRVPGGGNFDMVLGLSGERLRTFAAAFSSFAFDYVVRQKLSNMHLQFSVVKQLPIPRPDDFSSWGADIADLVDRLNASPSLGTDRDQRRAKLDAMFFHLYGISRDDASYILDTFPIVKRKDEAKYAEYRTKALILAAYDELEEVR